MKNQILVTLLLLLSSVLVRAQSNIKSNPQTDSVIKVIPVDEGRHSSYLYTIGGKLQTRKDVLFKLLAYAPSAGEVHLAKNAATWGYVSIAGLTVSGFAATLEYVHNNRDAGATTGIVNGQTAFIYKHHSLTGAYILTGVATAFLVSSFIHLAKATLHSNRALKLYNQRFE